MFVKIDKNILISLFLFLICNVNNIIFSSDPIEMSKINSEDVVWFKKIYFDGKFDYIGVTKKDLESISYKKNPFLFGDIEIEILDYFMKDKTLLEDIFKLPCMEGQLPACYSPEFKNILMYDASQIPLTSIDDCNLFIAILNHEYRHLELDHKYPFITHMCSILDTMSVQNENSKYELGVIFAVFAAYFNKGLQMQYMQSITASAGISIALMSIAFIINVIMSRYLEYDADIHYNNIDLLSLEANHYLKEHNDFKLMNNNAPDWILRIKHFLHDWQHPYYLDRVYFIQQQINKLKSAM